MLSFLVVALGILSVNPLQLGFQFLEKIPNRFECAEGNRWLPCTKEFICSKYAEETKPESKWSFTGVAYSGNNKHYR